MTILKTSTFLTLIVMTVMSCKNKTTNLEPMVSKPDTTKLAENIPGFSKTLELQGFKFEVSTTGEGSIQQLTIKPYGLKIDNSTINRDTDGSVTNAEIADLNSDGYPELLIYTQSAGSGSYGDVIEYSVNVGKSMSSIYFPPITNNPKANKGYMGHDEFAVGELTLLHRFQTYNEGDSNSNPTGKNRQIQYKLKGKEASRHFEVDKIEDY